MTEPDPKEEHAEKLDVPLIHFAMDHKLAGTTTFPEELDGVVHDGPLTRVHDLLTELSETFICAMKRRGVIVQEISIEWSPEPPLTEFAKKIVPVTRLRAVIETEYVDPSTRRLNGDEF